MTDPEIYSAVRAAARPRLSALATAARSQNVARAARLGPDALTSTERLTLLHDASALDALHQMARTTPVHPSWYSSSASAGRATISITAPERYRSRGTFGTAATLARIKQR